MNSNTTDRPRSRYSARRRAPGGHRVRTKAKAHPVPQQSSAVPILEPTPCDTNPAPFSALGLEGRLLEGIRDLGFVNTRPIQTAVIPLALDGHDLIACAETGSGKTAAFVVPMLQRLLTTATGPAKPGATTEDLKFRSSTDDVIREGAAKSRVLVLAPTRELAVQIEDEIHGLSYHSPVTSAAVYGGVEMGPQERALRAGVDIIVATPGRLMDHMRQQNADLSGIELLVLDEADRMMDMGFWPDVRRIVAALPGADGRQTLLFSATMPDEVVRDALAITRDPKFVQVGRRSAPATSITHHVEPVARSHKVDWLIEHLRRPEGPVLVFMRTKAGADRLAGRLAAAGIRCTALHADRSQDQRRIAVEGFKSGKYKVLVATDLAARGLDIDRVHTVVNYEVPDSPDGYVHRVGRTGRSGAVGRAITLVSPDERRALATLAKSVGIPLE